MKTTHSTPGAARTALLLPSSNPASTARPDDIRAVVIYSDPPSGCRAMRMLGRAIECENGAESPLPVLWRADLLDDAVLCDEARRDIVAADLLVLSFDAPAAFSSAVENAVSAFLASRHGAVSAILALFGPDDEWSIAIQEPAQPEVPLELPIELASTRSRLPESAVAA